MASREVVENLKDSLLALAARLPSVISAAGQLRLEHAAKRLRSHHVEPQPHLSEASRAASSKFFADLARPLHLFLDCERIYHEMRYLDAKRSQREAIKHLYNEITSQLLSTVVPAFTIAHNRSPHDSLRQAVRMVQQICQIVACRVTVITLYQSMLGMRRCPDYDELLGIVQSLAAKYSTRCTHPALRCMKLHLLFELYVLRLLFQTQVHLGQYSFHETILSLTRCKHVLAEWVHVCIYADTHDAHRSPKEEAATWPPAEKAEPEDTVRAPGPFVSPAVLTWCKEFFRNLLAKASLYFYRRLQSLGAAVGDDLVGTMAKLDMDYVLLCRKFVKRTGIHQFHLVLDGSESDLVPVPGQGYQMPPSAEERRLQAEEDALLAHVVGPLDLPPTPRLPERVGGLAAWPAVFSVGSVDRTVWPSLISIITDSAVPLQQGHVVDVSDPFTHEYCMVAGLEPRLFLTAVYRGVSPHAQEEVRVEGVTKRNTTALAEFGHVVQLLRLIPLFARLCPRPH